MSAKLARLRVLERIRGLQEEMERATLERAVAAANQVETALSQSASAVSEAGSMTRAALHSGDRREWLFADAQHEVARSNISRLGVLLQQRQAAIAPAMESYRTGRTLHEQAKVLLTDAECEAAEAQSRKSQAELDEWSTSRWARRAQAIVKDS